MSCGLVAFHYPDPEHVEESDGRCHQVIDVGRTQPGFLRAEVWVTPDGDAAVATGAFESEDAFRASADATRELGATPDGFSDLEVDPRQAHFLLSR